MLESQLKKQKNEAAKTTEYGKLYDALCKEFNRVIKIEPFWKLERDGSYVLKINRFIGKEDPNGR